ncbi:MAG: DUF3800 domain-containing protein [Bacilli bacterium]
MASKMSREESVQVAKDKLQESIAAGEQNNIMNRVAYLLNLYPQARDSDITLQLKYWKKYQHDIYKDGAYIEHDLYHLIRLTSIARARAKIQNEYGLFQASATVRRHRRNLEEIEIESQLSNQPGRPIINIFCDESGKNDAWLVVGGIWILNVGREEELRKYFIDIKEFLNRGRSEKQMIREFHFSAMQNLHLEAYKEFFGKALQMSDAFGFKAVIINRLNAGGRTTDDLLLDLHYQLVHLGIEHEISAGRVTLPRQINFWKDKDGASDDLTLKKLQQYFTANLTIQYTQQLTLGNLGALDSLSNYFVQIADLFTASLSRILNRPPNGSRNYKDEFAEFVLSNLGIDSSFDEPVSADFVMLHRF